VLQEGEFTTVGGATSIKSNVRIVAATHRQLAHQINQGLFREDLFYRLNVVPIRLPPLRERLEDIPDLARLFLRQAAEQGLARKEIDGKALARLRGHDWPGNVRELENLIRRLTALYPQETITEEIVAGELAQMMPAPERRHEGGDASLTERVERHLSAYFAQFPDALPPAGLYGRIVRDVERPLIAHALAATRGNQIKAAELLGLNRNTLRKKIRELDIRVIRTPKP
jgi:two-component system nitrogen regulation response regulator GlnG